MATTDTNVPQVVVNKLTKAQYDAAVKDPTEFYAVTDAQTETADIADGAITTAKIANGAVTSDKIDFTTLIDKIYPVGSIYMSATLSTPSAVATALGGGTWVAWGSGRVPVGVDVSDTDFGAVEKTGGNKTNTYNFAHRHPIADVITTTNNVSGIGIIPNNESYTGSSSGGANPAQLGNKTISALQPYITCYMYKRTA